MADHCGVASDDFEFAVAHASTVAGRGVAVFGDWRAGQLRAGDSLYLHVGGREPVAVHGVSVEYARVDGGEQIALLLRDVIADDVPVGSVLRSRR
jgi:translation elongation factor EF-Tu-like GTPase